MASSPTAMRVVDRDGGDHLAVAVAALGPAGWPRSRVATGQQGADLGDVGEPGAERARRRSAANRGHGRRRQRTPPTGPDPCEHERPSPRCSRRSPASCRRPSNVSSTRGRRRRRPARARSRRRAGRARGAAVRRLDAAARQRAPHGADTASGRPPYWARGRRDRAQVPGRRAARRRTCSARRAVPPGLPRRRGRRRDAGPHRARTWRGSRSRPAAASPASRSRWRSTDGRGRGAVAAHRRAPAGEGALPGAGRRRRRPRSTATGASSTACGPSRSSSPRGRRGGVHAAGVVRARAHRRRRAGSNGALARRGRPAPPADPPSGRLRGRRESAVHDFRTGPPGVVRLFACPLAPNGSSSLASCCVIFGGSQLPKLAKNLGKAQKEFKDGLAEGQREAGRRQDPRGAGCRAGDRLRAEAQAAAGASAGTACRIRRRADAATWTSHDPTRDRAVAAAVEARVSRRRRCAGGA